MLMMMMVVMMLVITVMIKVNRLLKILIEYFINVAREMQDLRVSV